jgi:hypothetical protein
LTYPSPIPPGPKLRYSEARRYSVGGCPLFAADATWANDTAVRTVNAAVSRAARQTDPRNVTVLDVSRAFVGHRLCERGARQLQETGLKNWGSRGAAGELEWVNKIYFTIAPWQFQESLHPDYWGMGAERECVRLFLAAQAHGAAGPSYRCVGTGAPPRDQRPAMRLLR